MHNFSKDKNGIYYLTFNGILSIEDLITAVEEFRTSTIFPPEVKLLYNLSDAKINITETALESLHKYTAFSTQQFAHVRTAIVVLKPQLTAYSMLFSDDTPNAKIQRRVFSSVEGAKQWLI